MRCESGEAEVLSPPTPISSQDHSPHSTLSSAAPYGCCQGDGFAAEPHAATALAFLHDICNRNLQIFWMVPCSDGHILRHHSYEACWSLEWTSAGLTAFFQDWTRHTRYWMSPWKMISGNWTTVRTSNSVNALKPIKLHTSAGCSVWHVNFTSIKFFYPSLPLPLPKKELNDEK